MNMNIAEETAKYHQELANYQRRQQKALETVKHYLRILAHPAQPSPSTIPCGDLRYLGYSLQELSPLPNNVVRGVLNILARLPALYGPNSIKEHLVRNYINDIKLFIEVCAAGPEHHWPTLEEHLARVEAAEAKAAVPNTRQPNHKSSQIKIWTKAEIVALQVGEPLPPPQPQTRPPAFFGPDRAEPTPAADECDDWVAYLRLDED